MSPALATSLSRPAFIESSPEMTSNVSDWFGWTCAIGTPPPGATSTSISVYAPSVSAAVSRNVIVSPVTSLASLSPGRITVVTSCCPVGIQGRWVSGSSYSACPPSTAGGLVRVVGEPQDCPYPYPDGRARALSFGDRAAADGDCSTAHLRAALPGADRRVHRGGPRVRTRLRGRGRRARARDARARGCDSRTVRRRTTEHRCRGWLAFPRRAADRGTALHDGGGERRRRRRRCRRRRGARRRHG